MTFNMTVQTSNLIFLWIIFLSLCVLHTLFPSLPPSLPPPSFPPYLPSLSLPILFPSLPPPFPGVPVITDLSADSPSSSITCLSTGGPVTDITWLRNNVLLPSESADYTTSRAVMDTEEGTYASVLTVSTGQLLPGNYTCTVSNNAGNSTQTGAHLYMRWCPDEVVS